VVKQFDAAELCIIVAEVLAAADAVLVAQYLSKSGAHRVTALARLHERNLPRSSSLEGKSTRGGEREGRGMGWAEKRLNAHVKVWFGKQEMPVARARVSRRRERRGFTTPAFRAVGAVQSALGAGGRGR
jgi:hypothetical protein